MLERWNISIPQLSPEQNRRVFVWLPDSYDTDDKRYPVLYMFDGQNIFLDEEATYGKSWGMAAYLAQEQLPLIIVSVECSSVGDTRLSEYAPFTHSTEELGTHRGRARTMMEWMSSVFKPLIDEKYRTLSDRENTFLGGSSMGALISLYGVTHWNHIYSRAACLSPSLWINEGKVLRMLHTGHIAEHTLIYMDFGSEEIGNHRDTFSAMISTSTTLIKAGCDLTFRIVPGGSHCEASWEERVPIFMKCLGF